MWPIKIIINSIFGCAVVLTCVSGWKCFGQNVGILTTTPDLSAMLDVSATDAGLLIPRMTDAERQLLKDPAAGLIIYNTDSNAVNFYNGSGWQEVIADSTSAISGSGPGPGIGVAVNMTGATPDPSAALDISSTEKGMLLPRTTQGAVTPVAGLIIYNTASNEIDYHDGSTWQTVCYRLLDNNTGSGAVSLGFSINGSGAVADPSAILDIVSTGQGLLIPRMTNVQRDALNVPATGLMIYNTTDSVIEIWKGTNWQEMAHTAPSAPTASTGTNITFTAFDANWNAVIGATSYYLDVATNATFTSFVSGFNGLNAGNVVTYSIIGLTCNTTYYYRVRANNACSTSASSNTITVTTSVCDPADYTCTANYLTDSRDGQQYGAVTIPGSTSPYCNGTKQIWMCENLNIGTQISGGTSQTSGVDDQNTSIEKYCYGNSGTNCTTYGGLYQWNEMMAYGPSVGGNGPGPQGICPTGWHLPTDNELKCMEMNLGMTQTEADKQDVWRGTTEGTEMKAGGTSGFEGLLGGNWQWGSGFQNMGIRVNIRAATLKGNGDSWRRKLDSGKTTVRRDTGSNSKKHGLSVRCVEN